MGCVCLPTGIAELAVVLGRGSTAIGSRPVIMTTLRQVFWPATRQLTINSRMGTSAGPPTTI